MNLADAFLFWFLAILTITCSLGVIFMRNPIFSALHLVMAMVGIAALFVTLGAYFIAGVQLIVYAGAVMVLFVMVLMLFDLKNEQNTFVRGQISKYIKLASIGILSGLIIGTLAMSTSQIADPNILAAANMHKDHAKALGILLFTKYLFVFEILGVLLLVVAIGAVALARAKGGTRAK